MGRKREVQRLLAEAKRLIDEATKICEEDGIEDVSIMGQSFRIYRDHWGRHEKLRTPGWYSDEYWQSSTADCELDTIWEEEEEK